MTKPARGILLWVVAGTVGALLVAWAFPRVHPLVPKDWEVSESEARLIALEALRDLGEAVHDPYVVVRIRSDAQLEHRLLTLAAAIDREKLAASRLADAQLCWDVMVYPPGSRPGEWTYRAFVAPHGEILMLRRRDPEGTDPDLDDDTARRLGAEYLLERRIDLTSFETPGEVVRNQSGTVYDVRLQLRSEEAALGPDYPYGVEVYFAGSEVAGFGLWYDDPDTDEVQRLLRQTQIFSVGNVVVLFLVLPFVAVAFLKRYHDGQLGVRRGVQILVLTLVSAALYTVLNQDSISEGSNIGFITRQQMAWIAAGISLIFFHFPAAVLGLMSWSAGEYFCRQVQPQKLAALDSVLRFKWSNATVARSALSGVGGGLLMTGLLLALAVAIQRHGVWALADMVYNDALGQSLGSLSTLSQSVATAVPLYLFAALLVPCWVRHRLGPKAGFVASWSAITLFVPQLIALPLRGSWAIWAIVAVVPAVLFHFGDLLSVLLAGVTSQTLLAAAPGFFTRDTLMEANAWAALLLAALPLLLSLRSLAGGEEFVYAYDDVPSHVRRIAERERQRVEIETAAEIQSSILPELPEQLNGVEIACSYLPATEVGGDFYDVLALEDGRLAVAVGDVAGHGVSSGLVMSMAKSALAVQVTFDPEVESVFRTLNRMVYQSSRRRLLATLCYALVDPRRRELRYASAGHLYPYRVSLAGQVHGLETASYPLGVRDAIDVQVKSAKLGPSDVVFLCSDGLVEACAPTNDEPFGFERLEASLSRHAGKTPAEMRDAILDDVNAYCGERPRDDDLTLLVLRLPAD